MAQQTDKQTDGRTWRLYDQLGPEGTSSTTNKRVHYMVQDPLEVGLAPAIFPCIFIPPSIVEPLLLDAKIH
jgi:hypothetical protein